MALKGQGKKELGGGKTIAQTNRLTTAERKIIGSMGTIEEIHGTRVG